MPIGMLIRKIHRHDPTVTIAPPRLTARMGAASAGHVEQRDGADQIGLVGAAKHRQPADGHHHRAADALQHAHGDEHRQRHRCRAPDRRRW